MKQPTRMTIVFCCLLFLLGLGEAGAAAINHCFVEQNTNQTTTSATYTDVSNMSIAANFSDCDLSSGSGFSAGKKYLIVATGQAANSDNDILTGVQLVHGSTAFAESEALVGTGGNGVYRSVYQFFTVWTAVSAEGIKMQFKSDGSNTANLDFASILVINLSDDVTENTDWCFNERATDDALTDTGTDGGSCTLTPSGASDWLVMTYMQGTQSVAGEVSSELIRSGEASSSNLWSQQPRVTSNSHVGVNARVFALTAASNTFKETSTEWAGTHTRLHSSVFMLNLNKFKNHASAYTAADLTLGNTSDFETQIQTMSITPDVGGNVWLGAFWVFDHNDGATAAQFRMQEGNADQPAGQTTAAYDIQWDNVSVGNIPMALSTMANLTAAAHTVDLDASASATGATAQDRSLWAVTMELAAVATATRSPIVIVVE